MKILPRSFYDRDTVEVARDLLGKWLIRVLPEGTIKTMIAETEAYRSDDPASHAFRGKTPRNAALFGPVGHTYVYFTYGIHYCVNIVARDTHNFIAGGTLIRGLIVLEGQEIVKKYYALKGNALKGPGIVTKALHVDRSQNDIDVTNPHSAIYITEGEHIKPESIVVTERIGISRATEKPWRFYLKLKP